MLNAAALTTIAALEGLNEETMDKFQQYISSVLAAKTFRSKNACSIEGTVAKCLLKIWLCSARKNEEYFKNTALKQCVEHLARQVGDIPSPVSPWLTNCDVKTTAITFSAILLCHHMTPCNVKAKYFLRPTVLDQLDLD